MSTNIEQFMQRVVEENPGEPEFHQAVHEVAQSILPILDRHPDYARDEILERMTEPERILVFRVPWVDDSGKIRVNRGYRVQMNSAIGPYKGGLRFDKTVNLSILKFLAFEQVFKNALTTLPMGGGKGGSNFNPIGKSDREVMKFCQSFMTELARHIGPDTDVPAGDIGVGRREIGFLFGQYKRMRNAFEGVLTGKGKEWGGSLIRPEATGYGVVYFASEVLKKIGEGLKDKTCLVSGAGNVALYAAEKILQMGGKVVSLCDITGAIYDPDGIDKEKLEWTKDLVFNKRRFLGEYAQKFKVQFFPKSNVWKLGKADVAFPCATQNELNLEDAKALKDAGVRLVCEGANMPTTPDAVRFFQENGVLFAPGKAANAGGVAVSGLEMTQNAQHYSWTADEVEGKLFQIMVNIHRTCVSTAARYDAPGNYVVGANIAGFLKVAQAMADQGAV
ncbi:MAG: NADP-specific glutamate dehydrogenase [bacterium]|jgi:glutamate dehydrogenase/leucine dehydrogenase